MKKRKKVVIAMSGGVDSSVTAALLKEQGYECIGMHFQFWNDKQTSEDFPNLPQNKCCTLNGLEDARQVASQLNIPFYVMNVVSDFKTRVVDYFLESYSKGETPNPCVECNRHIKFGEFLKRAKELKADFIASGHYAQVKADIETGRYELQMARDKTKDQTYFLYHLSQDKLKNILFPLGDFLKTEVYELARKFGLARVVDKPQSQGLCFFSARKPKHFLKRYIASHLLRPGPIISVDGRYLGEHQGLPLYTIGQRSGLGIGGVKGEPEGEPWYVVRMDRKKNTLIVGHEEYIYLKSFVCKRLHFISAQIPTKSFSISARIRHRGELIPAKLEIMEGGQGRVTGERAFFGVAPGQTVVFYNQEKVLGGGIILSCLPKNSCLSYEKEPPETTRRNLSLAY